MKKLFLVFILIMTSVAGMGYEFMVSSVKTPVGKPIPKRVLVRGDLAVVLFVKTSIPNVLDLSDTTIQQEKTKDGYVFYIAPNWPAKLWLTAPGFKLFRVELGEMPPNSVREITVSAKGKDPRGFTLQTASLSFVADMSNATAAVTEPYTPEIWVNTDASFAQIKPLFKEGHYRVINNRISPYRIGILKNKTKAGAVFSAEALRKLGDVSKVPLEERVVYELDVSW